MVWPYLDTGDTLYSRYNTQQTADGMIMQSEATQEQVNGEVARFLNISFPELPKLLGKKCPNRPIIENKSKMFLQNLEIPKYIIRIVVLPIVTEMLKIYVLVKRNGN